MKLRYFAPMLTGFIGGLISAPLFGGITNSPIVVVPFLIIWSAIWAYFWTWFYGRKENA